MQARKSGAGSHHQTCAGKEKRSQSIARRNSSDQESEQGRTEQCSSRNVAYLE